MRTSKLLLAALTAALALTLGAATANAARSFSASNNTLLTYVSPGLTFTGLDSGNRHICAVTLTASLHATAAKIRGTLIGFVNGARAERCRNNLNTRAVAIPLVSHRFPWHITLNTFRGTLPRITEITILVNNALFLLELAEPFFGRIQRCLYSGTFEANTRGRTGAAEYTVELLIPVALNTANLWEDRLNESVACDSAGELSGTFHATLPPIIRLV